MGIRFRCPNGHKLHVKSFQAGKRGLCPQCGVKLLIPLESDPALVQESKPSRASTDVQTEGTSEVAVPIDPQSPPSAGGELAANGETQQPAVPADGPPDPTAQPQSDETSQQDLSSASVDPITEAPHAIWYVQPPSGGQYGPASGDIMRTWISEGRVTRDSLVWREGWAEWKLAGPLFPGLLAGPTVIADGQDLQIVPDESTGSVAEQYRRKKSTKMALAVVILLVIACLVLFATLIYVIKYVN
jgi:hypothetical protein